MKPDLTFHGRFSIEDRISRRSLTETYRATDTQTGGKVALKTVKYPLWLSASEREAHRSRAMKTLRAQARVQHAFCAATQLVAEMNDGVMLAREWVSGMPLSSILRQHGSLLPDEVSRLARELAGPIDALSDSAVSHGALTAENVVLTHEGAVRMTDAGFATALRSFEFGGAKCLLRAGRDQGSDLAALATLLLTCLGGSLAEKPTDPVTKRMLAVLRKARKDPRPYPTAAALAVEMTVLSNAAIVRRVWRPATQSGLLAAFGTVCVLAVSDERPKSQLPTKAGGAIVSTVAGDVDGTRGPSYEKLSAEEKSWLGLEVRRQGIAALTRPAVAEAFHLDPIQRTVVASILKQQRSHLGDVLERLAMADAPQKGAASLINTKQVRDASTKSVLAALKPSQLQLWNSLAGQAPAEDEPVL
jgi:tRNA A-37 threonylcarbamoyl transferase component Bud32